MFESPHFDFAGLMEQLAVFEKLMKKHLPKISKKFKAEGVETLMFAHDWFQTLFVRTFAGKMEVVGPIFDNFVEKGWVVMHGVGLGLLAMQEAKLLDMEFEDILMGFGTIGENVEIGKLLQVAEGFKLKLK